MAGPDGSAAGPGGQSRLDAREAAALEQPFDADGLYALRAAVAAHAGRFDLPDDQLDDLLIVAGELATNAIRHGGGSGRLRLWRVGSTLRCQVTDRGPGITDPTLGDTPPDPTDTGGRGLWICRQLSDSLTIRPGDHGRGTTITAVIRVRRGSRAGAATRG